MESINHITVEGERIDMIAVNYYGDNYGIRIIADANPSVPLNAVFPAGTRLVIPVIDDETNNDKTNLPPWKQ